MENFGYKLVITTDGHVYFGEWSTRDRGSEAIVLEGCCMLEMIGVGKPPLDIAVLGLTEKDNVNITQCVNVSIFNPSLCIDVSNEAVDSILSLITLKRNQELANVACTDK